MDLLNKLIAVGLLLGASALSIHSVSAAVIHDNGSATIYSNTSDTDSPTNTRTADNFTIAPGTMPIQSITWSGVYSNNSPSAPDDFTVTFYLDNSGVPDPVGVVSTFTPGNAVNRVDSGSDTLAHDIYNYQINIAPFALAAGDYWISIVNNTAADVDDDWQWSLSNPTSTIINSASISGTGSTWTNMTGEMTFNLNDAPVAPVPVPAAAWLMGSALMGLVGFRRKKLA